MQQAMTETHADCATKPASELVVGDRVRKYHVFHNGRKHRLWSGEVRTIHKKGYGANARYVLMVKAERKAGYQIEVCAPSDVWETY